MKMNGIGNAKHEMPPKRLAAGPVPMLRNIGLAAKGRAHANSDRKKVFAATALAA